MPDPAFVHLRVQSAASTGVGAVRPDALAAACRAQGMPAVGVADATLAGMPETAAALARAGVQPIVACEVRVALDGVSGRDGEAVVLVARDESGWRSLMALSTLQQVELRPVTPSELARHRDGLIALTGGYGGPVDRALLDRRPDLADARMAALKAVYGADDLYVEVQRCGLPRQALVETPLVGLADKHGLPLVATNHVRFLDAADHEAQEILMAVGAGRTLFDADRPVSGRDQWLKPEREMERLFHDLPDAVGNTVAIMRRCSFMPRPAAPRPPRFPVPEGWTEAALLRRAAGIGLDARLDAAGTPADARPAYRERLDRELGVIGAMGFPGYFLAVADFVGAARAEGIAVGPGRGSAAGSLAAWALGITDVDPVEHGLIFERFLNPERVGLPDIDVDLSARGRERVVDHVRARFGADRVARIGTAARLGPKAAVRDAGRAMGLPPRVADRIARLAPDTGTLAESIAQGPLAEVRARAEEEGDHDVLRLLAVAERIEGLGRASGVHAAGVVVSDRPLAESVPLARAADPSGDGEDADGERALRLVTQYDMRACEAAGLTKLDLLGLRTLDVVKDTLDLVEANDGARPDLARADADADAYAMLAQGHTWGVFQLSDAGMTRAVRRVAPSGFADVVATTALHRPGPMAEVATYADAKHGRAAVEHPHPLLEPVLRETFGVMVYQEQVMLAAQVMAGYSLAEADLLRRAMSKKDAAEMARHQARWVEGCARNGVALDDALRVFRHVERFAGYGFNKSHAVAYAKLTMQTAHLKLRHPAEFLAASMNSEAKARDRLARHAAEARRMGVPVMPPDINASAALFEARKDADGAKSLAWGLCGIKGVGAKAAASVVAEREANGPFASLDDLRARVPGLSRTALESLVHAGALDALGDRAEMLGLPGLPEPERLAREREAVGGFLRGHPLDAHAETLRAGGAVPIADLADPSRPCGRQVVVGALVDAAALGATRAGKPKLALTLSDATGSVECLSVGGRAGRLAEAARPGEAVLVALDVRDEPGRRSLFVADVRPVRAPAPPVPSARTSGGPCASWRRGTPEGGADAPGSGVAAGDDREAARPRP